MEREGDPKITCYQVNQSNFLIEKWVSDSLKIVNRFEISWFLDQSF